jgi:ABC-type multidrug transport system permease subunit
MVGCASLTHPTKRDGWPLFDIKNKYIFFAVCAILIVYLLYMMIRKRKGERADAKIHEPEL